MRKSVRIIRQVENSFRNRPPSAVPGTQVTSAEAIRKPGMNHGTRNLIFRFSPGAASATNIERKSVTGMIQSARASFTVVPTSKASWP